MRCFIVSIILIFITAFRLDSQVSYYGGIEGSIIVNDYSFSHIPIRELDSPIQFGYGFRLGMLVNEKYLIRTGLLRINHGLSIVYDWYIPGQPEITDSAIPIQSFYNYSYLTIPISIGYKFQVNNRIRLVPLIGFNFLFVINENEKSVMGDGSRSSIAVDLYGVNSNHIQLSAMISCEVSISDKWFINFEPFISKSLLKQNKPYLETSYFTVGGSVGINRFLN